MFVDFMGVFRCRAQLAVRNYVVIDLKMLQNPYDTALFFRNSRSPKGKLHDTYSIIS